VNLLNHLAPLYLISYLAFLFPIAAYLFVLALVNRRTNPVMVSGVGDFVGLLLACSGVLLISGPCLIIVAYDRESTFPVGAHEGQVTPFRDIWDKWYLIWVLYYWFVIGGAIALTLTRRARTVLYNVDLDLFDLVFSRAVEKLNLTQARMGHKVFLGPLPATPDAATPTVPSVPAAFKAERYGQVEIDPFPALCNLTLHWQPGSEVVRAELEDDLRRNLDSCRCTDNPAATWLLGISTLLFGMIVLVIVFMALSIYLPRRH
jgi:hypothetical protein